MQIISCDNYFILGVKSLISELKITVPDEMVIFDSGRQCVYILNVNELRQERIHDPFSAFMHYRHALLSRNASLPRYWERLIASGKSSRFAGARKALTMKEAAIVKAFCEASNQRKMALGLNMNEKTLSSQKIRGLRKLGVPNSIVLQSVWLAWNRAWPAIAASYPYLE